MTPEILTPRRPNPPLPKLTPLQAYVLGKCYSDGYSVGDVAEHLGIRREAVSRCLTAACDRVVRQGYPHPKPYGRGSREELRRLLPGVG